MHVLSHYKVELKLAKSARGINGDGKAGLPVMPLMTSVVKTFSAESFNRLNLMDTR